MKFQGKEDDFQIMIARYLDSLNVFWYHAANERKTSIQAGAKLKRKGVKAGVPDIMILEQVGGYSGFAIELKVGTNKATEAQLSFMEKLKKRNWKTLITNDVDVAIKSIDSYLNL